jgi:hypothetical protein
LRATANLMPKVILPPNLVTPATLFFIINY